MSPDRAAIGGRAADQPWCALACLLYVVLGGFLPSQPEAFGAGLAGAYAFVGYVGVPAAWGRYAGSRVSAVSGGAAIALGVIVQAGPASNQNMLSQLAVAALLALAGRFVGERSSAHSMDSVLPE